MVPRCPCLDKSILTARFIRVSFPLTRAHGIMCTFCLQRHDDRRHANLSDLRQSCHDRINLSILISTETQTLSITTEKTTLFCRQAGKRVDFAVCPGSSTIRCIRSIWKSVSAMPQQSFKSLYLFLKYLAAEISGSNRFVNFSIED